MKTFLPALLVCVASTLAARAAEPAPAVQDACAQTDNLIVGPRTHDRPLPLLSGDPARGFRLACSAPWSTLSPGNQPLAVIGCFYGGSLLQVANDAACGRTTGRLWVSSRWVVTSRDLTLRHAPFATCERLETSPLAATREFNPGCLPPAPHPGPRELAPKDVTPKDLASKERGAKGPAPKPSASPTRAGGEAAPKAAAGNPEPSGSAPATTPPQSREQ